jgi:serine/threonine protein kinase
MIGKTISNYKILEIIGSGGMGVVYKAEDTNLKRNVALKFLPPELTKDKETEERFIREAQSASSLQHNNICTIHEINKTDDGRFFICMDYYEGETLKEKISRGTLNFDETVDISIQISEGLEKAHEKGIIHRDIKPANIFITTEGVVKILDFGLAKLSGRTKLTKAQSTLGTVAYMSPEQASGDEVDNKTDIWSLGVILYEMIAGQSPFQGDYEQAVIYSIMNEDPKHPREFRNNLPEDFERIILRSLEKDPKSRYSTITELLKDLMNFQPAFQTPSIRFKRIKTILKLFRKPTFVIPFTLIILAVSFLLIWVTHRLTEIRHAKNEVIPEIERLAEEGHCSAAFRLATKAKQYIPDNPMLIKLWPRFSRYLTIRSEPNGANIFWKEYNAKDGKDWQYAGVTPLDSIRFPIGFSRIKVEKEGFRTVYDATSSDQLNHRRYLLDENGNIPESMVRIPSVRIWVNLQSRKDIHEVQIKDYLIDKYEVTNREYKGFVDSGGYRNMQYWKQPFMKDGQILSWNEAIALFIDKTDRPGPSTWQAGDYPDGEGDYPVTGVCWYEAEAYANFVGKSLPTYYHWRRASGLDTRQRLPKILGEFDMARGNSFVILASNFNNSGSLPVGATHAMSSFGTHDMAGNAREWCWNKSSLSGQRYILGGGWSDPPYMFNSSYYTQLYLS